MYHKSTHQCRDIVVIDEEDSVEAVQPILRPAALLRRDAHGQVTEGQPQQRASITASGLKRVSGTPEKGIVGSSTEINSGATPGAAYHNTGPWQPRINQNEPIWRLESRKRHLPLRPPTSLEDKVLDTQCISEALGIDPRSHVTYKGSKDIVTIDLDMDDEAESSAKMIDVGVDDDEPNCSPTSVTSLESRENLYETLEQISSDNRTLKPGKTVEMLDGEFLRIESVIRDITTTEIFLRGHRLRRAKHLHGLLELKLNEVVMILQVEETDPRSVMVKGVEQIPLAQVGRIRELLITNRPFPELSFRECGDEYRSDGDIANNARLVCRWKYIISFPTPRDKQWNKNSEKCLTRFQQSEIDSCYAVSDDMLRQCWRGDTVKGGACLDMPAEEEDFDKKERVPGYASESIRPNLSRQSSKSTARDQAQSTSRKSSKTITESGSSSEIISTSSSSPPGNHPYRVTLLDHEMETSVSPLVQVNPPEQASENQRPENVPVTDTPTRPESGSIWGSWRRDSTPNPRADMTTSTNSTTGSGYQRAGRGSRGMKVLKPAKLGTTPSSRSFSATIPTLTSFDTAPSRFNDSGRRSSQTAKSQPARHQIIIDITGDESPTISLKPLSLYESRGQPSKRQCSRDYETPQSSWRHNSQFQGTDAVNPTQHASSPDIIEISAKVTAKSTGGVYTTKYIGALPSEHVPCLPCAKRLKTTHRGTAMSPITDPDCYLSESQHGHSGELWPAESMVPSQRPASAKLRDRILSSALKEPEQKTSAQATAFSTTTGKRSLGQRTMSKQDLTCTKLRQKQRYTFGDAFCGAGGMSRGAKSAGFRVAWGFDFDFAAITSYRLNFYNTNCIVAWAHEFTEISVGDESKVDVLHLSPPCQVFSWAHTVDGKDDEMNSATFFAVEELVKRTKPRMVTLENTSGLPILHPLWLNSAIQFFTRLGFSVRWKVMNFAEYGLVQARRRLIILASCPGEGLPVFPKPTHGVSHSGLAPLVTVQDVISKIPRGFANHDPDSARKRNEPPYPADKPLRACITTCGGGNYHPSGKRDLTLREYACLQGFPLEHRFGPTRVKKQIGNAVPPSIAKILFEEIKKTLLKADGF